MIPAVSLGFPPVLAHGVGSRGDLPLPAWMFIWGATLALAFSFVALGALWKRPLLAAAAGSVTTQTSAALAPMKAAGGIARGAALLLFFVALWAGLFGVDNSGENVLPVTVFVIVWVGVAVASALFGNIWRGISPFLTIARGVERLVLRLGGRTSAPPAALGQWPAALGLFVFLIIELAVPSSDSPRLLGWALLIHTVLVAVAAARWGSGWVAEHEPFGAFFGLLAAMAPVIAARVRAPLSGLATLSMTVGGLAMLLIVLGGTTFDGFKESEWGRSVFDRPSGLGGGIALTTGLIISIALLTALYLAATGWTSRVIQHSPEATALAFAPSLVPVVFGYAIAHYAQLLVDETQTFVFRLSDPGGFGWNLFGGRDGTVDFNLISVDLIAWIQVLAILFGHVGAVIVAHDRALELTSAGKSMRSQFAMLFVMVIYSGLGLALLANA